MTLQVVSLVIVAVVLIALFRVLRSGRIREKYAALWILVGTAVVVLAVFPDLLAFLARLTGVQVASNLLFFLAILLLLGVSLHLSLEASKLEDEVRVLAEEVALLWHRLGDVDRPPLRGGADLATLEQPTPDHSGPAPVQQNRPPADQGRDGD